MMCLDSDLLIAILRGDKDTEKVINFLDLEGGAATTVINAYEILFGAKKSAHKEGNVKEARRLLAKLHIMDMTLDAAERASEIHAKLSSEGNIIDLRDIFIASIALSHGTKIVTRNEKDFKRVDNLEIERW